MHLTFVNSEGLEYSALSLVESERMTRNQEQEDSETESEFLVVDENSPLLLALDPPGTRTSKRRWKKKQSLASLLNFKIKRVTKGLPWIIIVTAFGMAAMVLIGFSTMFQDNTLVSNVTIVPLEDSTISTSRGLALQLEQHYGNSTNSSLA
ncbi:unnamed protein product [Orchesella dallaii]|uniref:Uncharacterized protein n=1 Tax=Orchesella dallaii TaxID=48710 RepID=A0ABP1QGT4_9HEXA